MANREERRKNDFDVKSYIKASNEIEGIYSEKENLQSLAAWAYLEQLGDTFTLGDIVTVQKLITINQEDLSPVEKGNFRGMGGNNVNVSVGGRLAPDYSYVPDLMTKWIQDLPEMTPLTSHIRFEAIHPFRDGNGRTGRMIYWFICKRRGIKPYRYNADTEKERQAYYRLFAHKLVIKLSNANWRFTPDKMIAGEDEKLVTFEATMAMETEPVTPRFDTEREVWQYLFEKIAPDAGVDVNDPVERSEFEQQYDVVGYDAIDLKIMENQDLEWWK